MCLFHVTYFDMQIIINMQQICKLTQYTIFLWFFEHIFTTFAWKEFAVLLPNHNHRKTDSLGVAMPSFLSPFITLSLFSSFCSCLKQKIPHKIWMETDSYVDSWTTIYRPQYHTTATNPNIFTHLASPKKKMATLLLSQWIQQSLTAVPHAKSRWSMLCQHLELRSCCGPVYCIQTAEMEG